MLLLLQHVDLPLSVGLLREARAAAFQTRVVLITSPDSANLRRLVQLLIAEPVVDFVHFLDELDRLPARLRALREPDSLHYVAEMVEQSQHLMPAVSWALAAALRNSVPPFTVAGLARLAHVSTSRFREQWRASGLDRRPSETVQLIVLAHAAVRRLRTGRWTDVAEQLGCNKRTLQRIARRLLMRELQTIRERDDLAALLQKLRNMLLLR